MLGALLRSMLEMESAMLSCLRCCFKLIVFMGGVKAAAPAYIAKWWEQINEASKRRGKAAVLSLSS